ncbi:hypothetical protein [Kitasatospora sp. NBC_00315]|uniref:hypothetical protein n=1 Tax=Kitasatospora sp. NBC_00315 TaxID=2975963 RepID=UPI003252500A
MTTSTTHPADRLLLLAPRIDETGLQLLTTARRRGLRAHTATSWRVPRELRAPRAAHLYGGPLFGDCVGRELDVVLRAAGPDAELAAGDRRFVRHLPQTVR